VEGSAILAAVAMAVIAGFTLALRARKASPQAARPISTKPADGVVERVEVAGIAVRPNTENPAIGRFVRIVDALAGASPHATRVVGRRGTPPLSGEIVLWSIFIGRDGISWSDREVALARTALERAAVWIEQQAMRYAAALDLRIAAVDFVADDGVDAPVEVGFTSVGDETGPSEGDAETHGIASASRAASALGFRDLIDLIERIEPRVEADRQAWIVHVRRRGQSFAVAPDLTPIPGLSLAFCYLREASFSEPIGFREHAADPVTLAHELLHLFGASDKYGFRLRREHRGLITSRDIMRLEFDRLSELRVDGATAREIGWPRLADPSTSSPETKQPTRSPRRRSGP
jgi:hypothetical protein